MFALSLRTCLTWLLIIFAANSHLQVQSSFWTDGSPSPWKLSRHVRDTENGTITEDKGNGTQSRTVNAEQMGDPDKNAGYDMSIREDICSGCPSNWKDTEVTTEWVWIWAENERTNYLRRLHGSPDLLVNWKLCKCAQLWANKLLKQEVEEVGESGWCLGKKTKRPQVNISPGPFNPLVTLVDSWYEEIQWWDYDKGFSTSPWGVEKTGQFIQMILPYHKYHCTAHATGGDKNISVGLYENPTGEKVNKMWWIFPAKEVDELEKL